MKILIVDDEILTRVGIKSFIEWEKYGFEIAGLAEDGKQAMEMIRAERPEIVLTDIKMPNMDGLELTRAIKKEFPKIKIIILSCYNEVEYVKTAIKLGAEDYVLKLSMKPPVLIDILNKIRLMIEKEGSDDETANSLDNEFRMNKYILKENIYRMFVVGSINQREMEKKLKNIGIDLCLSTPTVLYCEIDDIKHASVKSSMHDKNLLKFAIVNILDEILSMSFTGDAVEIMEGNYLVVIENKEGYYLAEELKNITDFYFRVNNAFKNYLNITASFGGYIDCNQSVSLLERYNRAQAALEHKFYEGRGCLIFFDASKRLQDGNVLFNGIDEAVFMKQIYSFDITGIKATMKEYFKHIANARCYKPACIKKAVADIVYLLAKVIKRYDFDRESLKLDYCVYPTDLLMEMETLGDIEEWFKSYIDSLMDCLDIKNINVKRSEIKEVVQYILGHINEVITLDDAARISGVSRCYFSSIFKKNTGVGFTDYVNKLKVERAKLLLQESDLKVYEAAEMVGIADDKYFSKIFKKHLGFSPGSIKKIK